MSENQSKRKIIAGVDESGRGCLFGRVYTALCILNENFNEKAKEEKIIIRDSKKMTVKQRNRARIFIEENSVFSVSFMSNDDIDQYGILTCVQRLFNDCVRKLGVENKPDLLLVDGNIFHSEDPNLIFECVVKGDMIHPEISCASILAKTYRDEWIESITQTFPSYIQNYNLLNNKGYGTRAHFDGIKEYGLTSFHRKSFCRRINI